MPRSEKDGDGASPRRAPFPAIADSVVGAGLVPTADARELHASLEVGRDFTTWIKARLERYGFVENVDYVTVETAPPIGGAGNRGARIEYHLTLDTAKEIAMVENNARGREVRRYFIECERRTKAKPLEMNDVGGMVKRILAKQLKETIPALVRDEVSSQQHAVVRGVSAGQVLEMGGVTIRRGLRGLACWVSSRLRRFHASKGVPARIASLGSRTAYVFDPLISREWLASGGKAEIEQKLAERRGQGVLPFVKRPSPKGDPA